MYLKNTLIYFNIIAIVLYFYSNLLSLSVGTGYIFLAITFLGTFFLLLSDLKHNISVPLMYFYLFLFLGYFLMNLFYDTNLNLLKIRSFTIGTTGGVLFSFILGDIISYNISLIKYYAERSPYFNRVFYLLFSIIVFLCFLRVFLEHMSVVRHDLFLIKNQEGFYQRAGNFLLMQTLLHAFLLVVSFNSSEKKLIKDKLFIISNLVFFLNSFLMMLLSQLVGSNSGFVAIAGIVLIMLSFLFLSETTNQKNKLINFRSLFFGWIGKGILKAVLTMFCLIFIISFIAIQGFSFNFDKLRITGFGKSSIASVENRIYLLKNNFFEHFSVNPILGNIEADALTTGEGTYVHSILNILPSLGIIGTGFFVMFLVKSFKRVVKSSYISVYDKREGLFCFLSIVAVFSFNLLWATYTWTPFWFSLGLFTTHKSIAKRVPGEPLVHH